MVLSVSNTVKPLWQNSKATRPKDDLFAAIDDYSRELYAFRPMQNHRHGQTVNQAKKQPALPFSKCKLLFSRLTRLAGHFNHLRVVRARGMTRFALRHFHTDGVCTTAARHVCKQRHHVGQCIFFLNAAVVQQCHVHVFTGDRCAAGKEAVRLFRVQDHCIVICLACISEETRIEKE